MNKSSQIKDQIYLGVDPGTNILGYGLILKNKEISLIKAGIINLEKEKDPYVKLQIIFSEIQAIIKTYKPESLAIESQFFGKNIQSMYKLGRAQGVAIASAINENISVFEYAPKEIKRSITGNGNASKEQVAAMVGALLNLKEIPKYLDATDAIAAAVCHSFRDRNGSIKTKSGNNYKGWQEFLSSNPDKQI